MKPLLVMPIVIPLMAAALALIGWGRPAVQRVLAMLGAMALLFVSGALLFTVDREGIQVVQIGGWPAPFGITLVADLFSAIMVLMAALMGAAVVFYSIWSMDEARGRFAYYPLLMLLMMGVCGAFLTGDIFNLYVWFEVMLMASFVLLALGGERAQLEGALKYVTLNLISSALFLSAVGILYGVLGTLNMADLSGKIHGHMSPGLVTSLAMLFLVAFGIKSALFPLFFWLPASYHTPPVAVTAIFAALLTKVGAYSLIRVFTLLFTHNVELTHPLILTVAGLTMLTGVLGAAAHYEMRRILAFHIVSQIGYIIMGLGLFTVLGLAGAIYFMVHNILAKTNLFLISGITHRLGGSFELKQLGGFYRKYPLLSICFFISAMSLAGAPPLSGFVGKLLLVMAGLRSGSYCIVGLALFVSILTLYSMTKIWAYAFWQAPPAETEDPINSDDVAASRMMMIPVLVLSVLIVLLGICAEPCLRLAFRASEQLMNPSEYISAVLGNLP